MTDKQIAELLVGPHLIGLIFVVAASIQKRWQPKKINSLYGYRTTASMQNQQTWDEANRYSTDLMLKLGLILVLIGVVTAAALYFIPTAAAVSAAVNLLLILGGCIGSVIILLTRTERHLKKIFGDQKEQHEN